MSFIFLSFDIIVMFSRSDQIDPFMDQTLKTNHLKHPKLRIYHPTLNTIYNVFRFKIQY